MSQKRFTDSLRWFRHFRVEIFSFIMFFATSFEDVTLNLLAQDKICMRQVQSKSFCTNIGQIDPNLFTDYDQMIVQKDQVLARLTTFNFYQNVIYKTPVLLVSFFVASWTDRNQSAAKTLVCLAAAMLTLESSILLLNAIYFQLDVNLMLFAYLLYPLVGGGQCLGMISHSYLSMTSHPSTRVIRFMAMELIRIVASTLATFLGGQLLGRTELTEFAEANGQLHNYHLVMMIEVSLKITALLYAVSMPFIQQSECNETQPLLLNCSSETDTCSKPHLKPKSVPKSSLFDLFCLQNLWESLEVCVRARDNGARRMLWLLLISMSTISMANHTNVVLFQFVQKTLHWDAAQFASTMSILYLGTQLFGFLVVIPILTIKFQVSDTALLSIGLVSYIVQNWLCGTVLTESAFCFSFLFGSIANVAPIAIRSKISKLVPSGELNRIFGMLTTLESFAPLLGIAFYSYLFNRTVSTQPGLVFQLSCALFTIPLLIAFYIGWSDWRDSTEDKSNLTTNVAINCDPTNCNDFNNNSCSKNRGNPNV